MEQISEEEKLRRRQLIASVLGTHAMESMFPDEATLTIIRAFESGELDDEMFSRAMDNHAYALAGLRPPLAGAA